MTRERSETLDAAIRYFTRDTGIMDGMLLACGTEDRELYALDGAVREDSVFDLASLTKLFTGLCALRLKEEGLLDFSRPVFAYDPRFAALKDVTVDELASFRAELRTAGRLDACETREEALRCLFGTVSLGAPKGRAYSDIPSMVLKYVIEAAAGTTFLRCVEETVLRPAGMTETWARVPEARRADCVRYDGEYRLEKDRRIHRTGPEAGVPHDRKAAILQQDPGELCGHAGLFSTAGDMARFCRAVLGEKIVTGASLRAMAENRTGHRRPDGSYSQYLGIQCYVRHPDQYFSEIPDYMGMRAFGNAGFTGNHLSVDPERGTFVFFLGNRVRERLTVLVPEEGKTLEDYGLNADGSGRFRWTEPDGTVREIPSSVKYVHQKDEHLHRAVAQVMGLRKIPFGT